jgi:8-oxo-dGTP pyrophosphatase MutT (NUDIX family)
MRDMTAALIIKDKKILLVHNTKHNGLRIEPPGGKREEESLEECVIREVKEELGLIIEPVKFFGVYRTNSPEGDFKVYMYLSEIKDGSPSLKEPEIISYYGWYSYEDMLELKDKGVLVPNLCSALVDLKPYL